MTRQHSLAAGVLLVMAGTASAQPRTIEIVPVPISVSNRSLEENAEQLEASLDVKRAQVQAAEIGVLAAKTKYNNLVGLKKNNVISELELEQGKIEIDAAIAQLNIRRAEMREVEVRLKQTKKRLDESKPGAAPASKAPPTAPTPTASPKSLIKHEAAVKISKAKLEKAKIAKAAAEAKVTRIKKVATTEEFAAAERGAADADLDVVIAQAELEVAEANLKEIKK